MDSLQLEQKNLVVEILSILENQEDLSLALALRKATRLAELRGEAEFKYLFQLHIDGRQKHEKRNDVQKWNKTRKPKWDVIGVWMEDREFEEDKIQGLSIIEIEKIISGIEQDIESGTVRSNALEELVQMQMILVSIRTRIRARIWNFVIQIHKELLTEKPEMITNKKSLRRTGNEEFIFIGHGRSNLWRDLKDLIQDRLNLSWDEFNRESTPGISTIQRLEDMLSKARFAFIIMTAEDEHSDGSLHARENVIHEAGLFQGHLGFRRAILLVEDGCSEFSNVQGLTQIRFPKGNILAKSEEIRRVLERERVL